MWIEAAISSALATLAAVAIAIGVLYGHRDRHHGGMYLFLGAFFLLIGAAAFAVGALVLRSESRAGWLAQLAPLSVVAVILWDVLSHRGY